MLNTFEQLIEAVQDDMNITDESPLYPLAKVKRAINRAYFKASGIFRWSGLEHAKKTTTQANIEYYDYPSDFRDDSVWRVMVDGTLYGDEDDKSPMKFSDYLAWREDPDNANATDKRWSTQKRRFFIHPVPTEAGLELVVWGQRIPDALSEDGDATIFSYSMPEVNEAVVLEAVAILKEQGEEEEKSEFRSTEAKQIILVAWERTKSEQGKYEKEQPFFTWTDFFKEKATKDSNIGNF